LTFSENMLVDAEAPEHSLKIASSGAMARRYPIQDAQDYWSTPQEQVQEEKEMMANGLGKDRSSPNTEGSASTLDASDGSMVGSGLSPGSGLTDTCATWGRPSLPDPALSLCGGFPG
jgi:hypothetical protein